MHFHPYQTRYKRLLLALLVYGLNAPDAIRTMVDWKRGDRHAYEVISIARHHQALRNIRNREEENL